MGITLEELQIGLCAMDPATPHGAVPGQLRCQFIFKYYNTSGTGQLTHNEFKYDKHVYNVFTYLMFCFMY